MSDENKKSLFEQIIEETIEKLEHNDKFSDEDLVKLKALAANTGFRNKEDIQNVIESIEG